MKSKICLFAYALLIGYLSLLPAEDIDILEGLWDKAQHLCAYGIFSLLAWWSFQENRLFYFSLLAITIYGVCLEFAQLFSAGRQLSILDVLANTLGVTIVIAIRHAYFERVRLDHH